MSKPLYIVAVDFSAQSREACRVAFEIAAAGGGTICLLHAYMLPAESTPAPFGDPGQMDITEGFEEDVIIGRGVDDMMDSLEHHLHTAIDRGELPDVGFTTECRVGLPEEVIREAAQEMNPRLIVMGTRGVGNKEPRIMGSVTAEVLDNCRFPVFSIPDRAPVRNFADLRHAMFFATSDGLDTDALDDFIAIMKRPGLTLDFVGISGYVTLQQLDSLMKYASANYADIAFNIHLVNREEADATFRDLAGKLHIDILGVPNRKRNIIARFFNPSLAHRLVFATDLPMLVLPV